MKIAANTLILIADGEKALFLRNRGDAASPVLAVAQSETRPDPPTDERPGRRRDTGVHPRSQPEDTDWHRLEKDRFAADLADMLYMRACDNEYYRLVVCAAPPVLDELRRNYRRIVADRIVAEVERDLTHMPVDEIERHLTERA